MADLRKLMVVFVIAILYAILSFSIISAVKEQPDYIDYCLKESYNLPYAMSKNCSYTEPSKELVKSCKDQKGEIRYKKDKSGCNSIPYCETCMAEYHNARKNYNFFAFIVSSIMGVIAILIGIFLKPEKNELHKWVSSGFLLGGLFCLFFGTIRYYYEMNRLLRPVIIFIELALVIFLFYREMRKDSKRATKKKPTIKKEAKKSK